MGERVFTVQLMDREFTIKTNEPSERMQKVVELINEYLSKIQAQRPFKDRTTVSLLTALNITSEYVEVKENKLAFEREVKEKARQLISLVDNCLKEASCGVRDR